MLRTGSPFTVGCLYALGATVLWSGNFVVARGLAGLLSPVEIAFWRWFLAFLMLVPFTLREVVTHWRLVLASWKLLCVMGILGISVINTLNYKAALTTDATSIALIATSAPVFMALISRLFLHEPLSRQQGIGLFVALTGVVVLVTRGDFSQLAGRNVAEGDFWALGGAVFFAVYTLLVRYRPAALPQLSFLTVIFGIGVLGLLPLLFREMLAGTVHLPTVPEFGCLVYIGLGASVLAFSCWNKAIDRIGPVRSGVLYYSIPLFSCVEASLFLGEQVTVPQVFGGVLIIGGILFSTFGSLRKS